MGKARPRLQRAGGAFTQRARPVSSTERETRQASRLVNVTPCEGLELTDTHPGWRKRRREAEEEAAELEIIETGELRDEFACR